MRDPAYVADTPHDLWWALQRQEPIRSTRSAEELEAWIGEVAELAAVLGCGPLERARYDDLGRLLAKAVLEHLESHPQDAQLPEVVRREVGKTHQRLVANVSTFQWVWAMAAAGRIRDARQQG